MKTQIQIRLNKKRHFLWPDHTTGNNFIIGGPSLSSSIVAKPKEEQ